MYIILYNKALVHRKNHYQSWYIRGNALLNLQKYPEAIASYQQAIKYKPDYQQAIEALKQAENQLPQPKNRPIIVPTVRMPNPNY